MPKLKETYQFRIEKKKEVLSKNKSRIIAKRLGVSGVYVLYVLNNHSNCSKLMANEIAKMTDKNKPLDYYFKKV